MNGLETLAFGGAVGAFLGLALVAARGGRSPARITAVLCCLGAAAHAITQSPLSAPDLGWAWAPIWAFSAMGAGLFWAFANELFEDHTRIEPVRFAPPALLLLVAIGGAATSGDVERAFWLVHNLISGALLAHLLIVIWSGWRNDLVESRRRLRGPVLGAGALYAVGVIVVQVGEILWRPADALSPLAAAALLLLGLASLGALLKADADLFGATTAPKSPPPAPAPEPRMDGEDARLATALELLMREERLYRREGLSIAGLALKFKVPEYRLRKLINQTLGHRNFNAFLNQWRLNEAKGALADPAQAAVPISTIALDAGFASLGPFNRAFKQDTGLTPSEYRTSALASATSSAQVQANQSA